MPCLFAAMLQPFVRYVTYPLWDRLNGSHDLASLRQLLAWERLTPQALADLQRQRLRDTLDHAFRTVPFYTEWFTSHGLREVDFAEPEALRVLPPLGKEEINRAGERMISTAVNRRTVRRDSTGGSTGEPLYFFVDEARKSWVRALTLRENLWLGCRPGDRIARLWGSGRDFQARPTLRTRLADTLVRRHRVVNAYSLNDSTLHGFLDELVAYRPALIVAYARAMYQAARYAEQHGIVPYQPKAIVITSESVSPDERDLIARVFRTPVVNRYASREVGQVASGCGQSPLLHVNDESVVVHLEPVAPAEQQLARVVVTELGNPVMPLIRYDTGDLGTPAGEPCPCGRPHSLLAGVEGRTLDLFVRRDGGLVPGLAFVHLFRQGQKIKTFQLAQEALDRVVVRLVLNGTLLETEWAAIESGIRSSLGGGAVEIVRLDCDQIDVPLSGKHRFAISKVSPS